MGLLSAFGSLSRVLGPIFVSYIYTNYGTYLVMAAMSVSMVISLILTLIFYKRLIPLQINPTEDKEDDSPDSQISSL